MSDDGLGHERSADKTLGEIVSEVSEKASLLVREEIELAKAEITGKVTKLAKGAAWPAPRACSWSSAIIMLFHALAWFFNDLFNWRSSGRVPGVTVVLVSCSPGSPGSSQCALFKKGAPPTPDLAIEEAKRTREQFEAQRIQRDQVHRSLERGEEVTR